MIFKLNLTFPLFVSSADRDDLTIRILQPVLFQSKKDGVVLSNSKPFTILKALIPPQMASEAIFLKTKGAAESMKGGMDSALIV